MSAKWERLRERQDLMLKGAPRGKRPDNWPFCIGCHLAAPDASWPENPRDPHSRRGPNTEDWGELVFPNEHKHREKAWLCNVCLTNVLGAVMRLFKVTEKKIKAIRENEALKFLKDRCAICGNPDRSACGHFVGGGAL